MRPFVMCFATVFLNSFASADPEADRVKKLFESKSYTVTWGTPDAIKGNAELEIGDGGGHSGTLEWLRFRPEKDGVDVLRVQLNTREPAAPKKPVDHGRVLVHRAVMKPEAYAQLLRALTMVAASKLKEADEIPNGFGTANFWVYARLTVGTTAHLDENWAGYPTSREAEFAKPQAAVALAQDAVTKLDFKDHALTPDERGWASAKFVRDWKKFKGKEYHWWVRERYIIVIGDVGNTSALPVLRDILAGELPKDPKTGPSEYRCAAYAITAAERLAKAKLWGPDGEDGDFAAARQKAIDLLRDKK